MLPTRNDIAIFGWNATRSCDVGVVVASLPSPYSTLFNAPFIIPKSDALLESSGIFKSSILFLRGIGKRNSRQAQLEARSSFLWKWGSITPVIGQSPGPEIPGLATASPEILGASKKLLTKHLGGLRRPPSFRVSCFCLVSLCLLVFTISSFRDLGKMYRTALRSAPSALRAARPTLASGSRRFASTTAQTSKKGTWKGTAFRWGLAAAAVYFYNTSPIFADELPRASHSP